MSRVTFHSLLDKRIILLLILMQNSQHNACEHLRFSFEHASMCVCTVYVTKTYQKSKQEMLTHKSICNLQSNVTAVKALEHSGLMCMHQPNINADARGDGEDSFFL